MAFYGRNPFYTQQGADTGAAPVGSPEQGGVNSFHARSSGPNPMVMNQTGAAPQGYRPRMGDWRSQPQGPMGDPQWRGAPERRRYGQPGQGGYQTAQTSAQQPSGGVAAYSPNPMVSQIPSGAQAYGGAAMTDTMPGPDTFTGGNGGGGGNTTPPATPWGATAGNGGAINPFGPQGGGVTAVNPQPPISQAQANVADWNDWWAKNDPYASQWATSGGLGNGGKYGLGNVNNPNFKQWQNTLARADQAGASMQPYQQEAYTRLSGLSGNFTAPSLPAFTSINGTATGAGGLATGDRRIQSANALEDQAASGLTNMSVPASGRALGSLGNALTDRYGTGQVDPTLGAAGLYGTAAQRATTAAQDSGNVTSQSLQLGDTLMGRMGYGQVNQQDNPYGNYVDAAAGALQNTPDRLSLAQNAVSALNNADDISLDRRLKEIRQQQAADGRLGLAADTQVNDLLRSVNADRAARNATMANDIASGSVGDNLQRLNAYSGLQQTAYGQQAGNQDRLFQRQSAAYGLGGTLADRNAANLLNQAQTFGGLQNTAFGQGQQNADNAFQRSRAAISDAQGLAGQDATQAVNTLGALGAYGTRAFGQGTTAFDQAQQERAAQLGYGQNQFANALGLNAQQFQQLMALAQYGDLNRVLPIYGSLASDESGVTRTRSQPSPN